MAGVGQQCNGYLPFSGKQAERQLLYPAKVNNRSEGDIPASLSKNAKREPKPPF
jgi:hypothetical protein